MELVKDESKEYQGVDAWRPRMGFSKMVPLKHGP